MRVLVCGSRDWTDETIVAVVLDGLDWYDTEDHIGTVVIEGGARGADRIAAEWCRKGCGPDQPDRIEHEQYPADWETHGKAAGPIRNQRMLDEGKPDVVIAFKDGFRRPLLNDDGSEFKPHLVRGGTEDLVRRAKAAGIPCYVVSHG